MKSWKFCLLLAYIHMAPHLPPVAGAITGIIWMVSAAIWWRIEK